MSHFYFLRKKKILAWKINFYAKKMHLLYNISQWTPYISNYINLSYLTFYFYFSHKVRATKVRKVIEAGLPHQRNTINNIPPKNKHGYQLKNEQNALTTFIWLKKKSFFLLIKLLKGLLFYSVYKRPKG